MILFIALSKWNGKPGDWTKTDLDQIPRRCPHCQQDSIDGHGQRLRPAHDQSHDWIWVRRGLCRLCRASFTFLPAACVPRSPCSLLYWLNLLQQQYAAGAVAAPLKDPDRVVDFRTVQRWRRRWMDFQSRFSELPTQVAWECQQLWDSLRSREASTA